MKYSLLAYCQVLCLALFLAGCNDPEAGDPSSSGDSDPSDSSTLANGRSPELNQLINAMKERQAKGLGTGSVKVNGAWTYTGYSFLDPVQGARLVAVDVTVSGHTPAFDFDDIEIVGGTTLISYGSDPHITLLSEEGKALPHINQLPPAPGPVRVLLIYGFPRETDSFTLYYWGRNLLLDKHTIQASGWELPFPKTGVPQTQ